MLFEAAVSAPSAEGKRGLEPEIFTQVQKRGFPCTQELELPPGEYVFRLGVRDNVTRKTGTATATVSVPGSHGPGR